MLTMDCKNILDMFTAYTDNDLDPAAAQHFERHVAGCNHCERQLAYFKKTLRHLQSVEPLPVPRDLLAGIHAKLEREGFFKRLLRAWRETDFSMSWQTATTTVLVAFTAMAIIKTFPMNQIHPDGTSQIIQLEQTTKQSEQTTKPHRDFRLPSESFPTMTQRSSNFTAPVSGFVSTKSRHGGNLPQPAAPESLYDSYTRIQPSGGPTHLLSPDMIITVHTGTPRNKAVLYHNLTHGVSWQTLSYDDELILYLPHSQLGKLQQIFADHQMVFPPPGAQMADIDTNSGLLTVAIRLR